MSKKYYWLTLILCFGFSLGALLAQDPSGNPGAGDPAVLIRSGTVTPLPGQPGSPWNLPPDGPCPPPIGACFIHSDIAPPIVNLINTKCQECMGSGRYRNKDIDDLSVCDAYYCFFMDKKDRDDDGAVVICVNGDLVTCELPALECKSENVKKCARLHEETHKTDPLNVCFGQPGWKHGINHFGPPPGPDQQDQIDETECSAYTAELDCLQGLSPPEPDREAFVELQVDAYCN